MPKIDRHLVLRAVVALETIAVKLDGAQHISPTATYPHRLSADWKPCNGPCEDSACQRAKAIDFRAENTIETWWRAADRSSVLTVGELNRLKQAVRAELRRTEAGD